MTDAPDDLVARRIVMSRETWEKLCGIAEEMGATSAVDVAEECIQRGLEHIQARVDKERRRKAKGRK